MSKIPMPTESADSSPEAQQEWLQYWSKVADIRTQSSKEYRQRYYANKTRLRQIAKLHELMDKYPDEVKCHA